MNTFVGRKIAAFLSAISLIGLWVYSIVQWPDLPARIPSHFDFADNANRWVHKSILGWFDLPAIATILTLLLIWLFDSLIRRYPSLINFSNNKERRAFIALPRKQQENYFKRFTGLGLWTASIINSWFFFLQYGVFQVAVGRWSKLPSGWNLGFIGLLLIVVVILLVQINRNGTKLNQQPAYEIKEGNILYTKQEGQ
ncbi:MAG: DUF1648 domain-containing protein [Actinomycetota bacterium]